MRKSFFILAIVTFAMIANVNLKAQFVDHDGDGWWDISSYNDLVLLASNSAYWGGQYEISHFDIFAPTFPLQNFTPIGNYQIPFSGKFRGYDPLALDDNVKHKINNIRQYWPGFNDTGLFGVNTGEITELVVCSFNITGANNTGALCGVNEGLINECEFYFNPNLTTTTVTGNLCVGGMVGWNRGGSITNCHCHMWAQPSLTYVTVNGNYQVGGLIGSNCQGINNQVSASDVYNIHVNGQSNSYDIGGFVGFNGSTIMNCRVRASSTINNTGYGVRFGGFVGNSYGGIIGSCIVGDSVSISAGSSDYVGGFAGKNIAQIELSKTGSSVTGNGFVGGFIGLDSGDVSDCESRGSVDASDNYAGGFVGCDKGYIRKSFVSGTGAVSAGSSNYVGGFSGLNFGRIEYSCTRANVSGVNSVGGFMGACYGTVHDSYSRGDVSSTSMYGDSIAGFVGVIEPSGIVVKCYSTSDRMTTGLDPKAFVQYNDYGFLVDGVCDDRCWVNWDTGGVGWTTPLMKTWMPWGTWDFVNVWEFDPNENAGYPSFIGYPNYKVNLAKNENINNIEVYPNPVSDVSTINITDSEKGFTTLSVYNTNGEKVETLYSGDLNTNEYAVNFNGYNYTSGMYYLVLESNNSRKMEPIVVKH